MLVGHLPGQVGLLVPSEAAVCAGEPCPEDMGTSFLGAHPTPGLSSEETTSSHQLPVTLVVSVASALGGLVSAWL